MKEELKTRKSVAIVTGIIIIGAIIIGALFLIPRARAKGTIVVTPLVDEETGKRVGKVAGGYPRVIIDGEDRGHVTDEGQLRISDLEPESHELIVVIPTYGEYRKIVSVKAGETKQVQLDVDMPNPEFRIGVEADVSVWHIPPDELADISVTLTNIGDIDSLGTSVLVLVYKEGDLSTPIATRIIDFGSLAPRQRAGQSWTKTWEGADFIYGPKEIIAVAVFDGYPFTPQNKEVLSRISVPQSKVEDLSNSMLSYLERHPEKVVNTTSKILLAWFG
ncbi:hypothetical protein AKJ37_05560 [candidate division MSBL1 archaeon SCGC-AAA259I09]|uniref:PEGA domain-containing protein n=1 Tax=candidate division MSBL1 archaeon SCGC-AAA259I09 TaxID=1698267 RepID=A0A133UQ67_9EURY|nr:hypothetical protein AKJ37_05560 [candidate division MSBL1 archaeon SCGC-AAA259I09]